MEHLIDYVKYFFMSMVPIIELRGALPLAIAAEGLNPIIAYIFCVIGNCLPVPFLILFVRPVFEWMRRTSKWLGNIVDKLEAKAHGKAEKVKKYEMLGLFLFVAIPLPGTGAWTGSLIAAVLGMRVKDSVPMICIGVVVAGILMTLGSGAVRMLIELF